MTFKLSGWILVAVIVLIVVAYGAGFISLELAETILGLAGVGGITGLRMLINSSGAKTYITAIGGAVVVVLYATGVITPEVFGVLIVGVLGLAVPAIGSAVAKTPVNGTAIKE